MVATSDKEGDIHLPQSMSEMEKNLPHKALFSAAKAVFTALAKHMSR